MGFPESDPVIDLHLAAVADGYRIDLHRGRHVALVDHGELQLPLRCRCQLRAEYYWGLPYSPQPPVVPFRSVLARKIVGAELKAGKTEHLVVGRLAQIVEILGRFRLGRIGYVYIYGVKQHVSLRNMSRRAAPPCGHEEHQGCRYIENSALHFAFVLQS